MSLFKVRDWWNVKCGSEEEFDKGCLCVGNVDNEHGNEGKKHKPFMFFSLEIEFLFRCGQDYNRKFYWIYSNF